MFMELWWFPFESLNHPKNCSRQGSSEMHRQSPVDINPVLASVRMSCVGNITQEFSPAI